MAILASVVAMACFGLGFILAYEQVDEPESAGPTTAPSTTQATPTTDAPTSTAATSTTAPTTSATTVPATTPTPTSTSSPATSPSVVPTPPATPPPTPASFDVTWPRDPSTGEMVLREGSPSAVVLHNVGGSPGAFTVQGSGFVTVGSTGTVTGVLQPGEVRSVPLVAGTGVSQIPPPHAVISVFGPAGILVTISVVIVS